MIFSFSFSKELEKPLQKSRHSVFFIGPVPLVPGPVVLCVWCAAP